MTLGIGGRALDGLQVVVGVALVVASILHVIRNGRALVKLLQRRSVQVVSAVALVAMGIGLAVSASSAPPRRGGMPFGGPSRQAARAAPAAEPATLTP